MVTHNGNTLQFARLTSTQNYYRRHAAIYRLGVQDDMHSGGLRDAAVGLGRPVDFIDDDNMA